ncbi:hypothetical protein PROFUN_09318 [Planoprotostelium fungivorum]|uniref:Uncharacterized protein n=1 Tax=Planoprotostelium fungivorum TaxID=1890364 RepID=A0A2P6NHB6_9EUKA|nr:hypothetical protein PROFUN_09318 [Planoprotostelium fungivorum]
MLRSFLGTKSPPQGKRKAKEDDLIDLGIDPSLLNDPVEDDGFQFDEEQDIEAMLKNAESSGKKKVAVLAVPDVSHLLGQEDWVPEVDVTEEDMNDPKLLASLRQLDDGGDAEPMEEDEESEDWIGEGLTEEDLKDPELLQEFLAMGGVLPVSAKEKKQKVQLAQLNQLIEEYRASAITHKRLGDIEMAKKQLATSKVITSMRESVEKGQLMEAPSDKPKTIDTVKAPPAVPVRTSIKSSVPPTPPVKEKSPSEVVEERAEEYKRAALKRWREVKGGDLSSAKVLLVHYKRLLKMKEDMAEGHIIGEECIIINIAIHLILPPYIFYSS